MAMKQVFIVGVGRSGTSLLHSMVAAHPQVAMLPETGFFRRYCVSRPSVPVGTATRDEDARVQRLNAESWQRVVEPIDAAGGETGLSSWDAYRRILSPDVAAGQSRKQIPHITYTGDKDPRLVEHLSVVDEVFPNSHIIHIVRDPRDVLASKMRAAWSQSRPWGIHVLAGRIQLDAGDTVGRSVFGERYHLVRYEDLVADPETVLRHLCSGLGIPYSVEMLTFADAASQLSGGMIEEWKQETLGPLLRDNVAKWREALTPFQVSVVEAALAPWFSKLGYAATRARSPMWWSVRGAARIASFLYRTYRRAANRRANRAGRVTVSRPLLRTAAHGAHHPRSTEEAIATGGGSVKTRLLRWTAQKPGRLLLHMVLHLTGAPVQHQMVGRTLIADHSSGTIRNAYERHYGPMDTTTVTVPRSAVVLQLVRRISAVRAAYRSIGPPTAAARYAVATFFFHYLVFHAVFSIHRPAAALVTLTSDRRRLAASVVAAERSVPIGLFILDRYRVIRTPTVRAHTLFCWTRKHVRAYQDHADTTVIMPSPVQPLRHVPEHAGTIGFLLNARVDVDGVQRVISVLHHTFRDWTILVRPHPGFEAAKLAAVTGADVCDWHEPLREFLQRVDVAVVPNSNAVVDALMHGVPTVYVGGIDTDPVDSHGYVADGIVCSFDAATVGPTSINHFYTDDSFTTAWNGIGYRSEADEERNALRRLLE